MTQPNLDLNALRYAPHTYLEVDSLAKAKRDAAREHKITVGSFIIAAVATLLLIANLLFKWSSDSVVIISGICFVFFVLGVCLQFGYSVTSFQLGNTENYFKDVDALETYLVENGIAKGEERELAKRLLKEDFVNYIRNGKNVFLSLQIVSDGDEPYGVVSVNTDNLTVTK